MTDDVKARLDALIENVKKAITSIPKKVSELENDKNYTPISLGITGAEKETYLMIATVDSNGVPTSWDWIDIDTNADIRDFIARTFGNDQNNTVGDVLTIEAVDEDNKVASIGNLHVLSEYIADSPSEQEGYLVTNTVMRAAIAGVLAELSNAVDANTEARHTHDNKAVLDSITGIVTPESNPIQKTDIVQYQVLENAADEITRVIPKKVSELQNDSGYLTEHQSLTDYAKKKELEHIPPMYLQDATVFEEILSQEDLIEIKSDKTLASSGDIVDAANYTTYIYQKAYSSIIKAGGCFRIFKYNGSPSKETLLEKSADNPPTATYNVGANEFLAISFYSKNNYPILRKYEKYWLNNIIENQKSKIKVKKTASNVVSVFVPTTDVNCYIRFPFTHFTDTSINADNWKIHEAYVSDGKNDVRKIVRAGEWEMAIQIDGRDDFIGGSLHGDEIVTSIRFYVNGILASSLTSETYCNEFKAVEISDLYDPSNHTTKVATHCKEYIFSKNGLLINQRIHWKAEYTLKYSYIAMLPILRADDKGNITSKYFDDSSYEEYDVSNDSFGGYPISYRKNVLKQTLYSEESGISAEVEILKREPYLQDAISFISDSEIYNKLYFSMCGNNYTTSPDVDWMTSVRYQINKSSN